MSNRDRAAAASAHRSAAASAAAMQLLGRAAPIRAPINHYGRSGKQPPPFPRPPDEARHAPPPPSQFAKSARDALVKCMASAQSTVITSRHKPPVNYHLQKVRPPCPSNLLRARRRDPQSRLAQTPGTAVRSPWAPAALSRVSAFPVCTVHQRVQEMRRGTHLVLGSAVPRAALTTRRLVRMRTHRSHDVVAMFGAMMMTA